MVIETLLFAEQLADEPPPDPSQFHDHGPVPLKLATVPALHRPAVVDVSDWNMPPLSGPQVPLIAAVLVLNTYAVPCPSFVPAAVVTFFA